MSVHPAANAQTFDSQARTFVECCSTLGELSINRLAGGFGRLGVTGSDGAAQALKLTAISNGSQLEGAGALCICAIDARDARLGRALVQAAGFLGVAVQLGQFGVGLPVAGIPAGVAGQGGADDRRGEVGV